MIVVIGGIKGGCGKTTVATNLAVCAAKKKKVLLIDADEQRSSSDWADQREESAKAQKLYPITTISLTGKSVYQQIEKMRHNYDLCLVDTGGRDTTSQRSALTIANKFIIPFKPRSFDVWTIGSVIKLIEEIRTVNEKLESFYLINQADSRGQDNASAMEILAESNQLKQIPVTIGYRKAFSNAASEGLGVIELSKSDRKSIEEMHELHRFLDV
jgi:chromosome partitioning protein